MSDHSDGGAQKAPPTPPLAPGQPPPAGPPLATESSRTFPCERCGADLTFSIGAQRLRCDHCGFERSLGPPAAAAVEEHDLEAGLKRLAERRAAGATPVGTSELRCDTCGATVTFEGTLTATACAYCGAPVQRDRVHQAPDRIPVDGLLTFGVEEADARQRLAAWVRGLWFAPGEFKRHGVEGRFTGVYLPYFTFDAMTSTSYAGQRGDHYWVEEGEGQQRRRELRVRWTPAWGDFQRFFDDVLVPAVTTLPEPLLEKLEPWPLGGVIPFTPAALPGKLAHTYDLELRDGFGEARQRMEAEVAAEVHQRIGGDEQRVESIRTSWAGLTYKHLLLPVWLLAYRYQGKSYRVVVNATTGEVDGERPWSPWKIAFAVLLGLLAAGLMALAANRQ